MNEVKRRRRNEKIRTDRTMGIIPIKRANEARERDSMVVEIFIANPINSTTS